MTDSLRLAWDQLAFYRFGPNSLQDITLAMILFVAIFVVLRLVMNLMITRLKMVARRTTIKIDDVIVELLGSIGLPLYLAAALYAASDVLTLPPMGRTILFGLLVITAVSTTIRFVQKFLMYMIRRFWLTDENDAEQVATMLGFFVSAILWALGIVLVLSNLGVNVISLVAGMGIGGAAIALATQNILSDIFSSFSIYLDKPFRLGDYIEVGDHAGTVKKIGIKTTRIQALQGEQIIIPNKELTGTRVKNFRYLQSRRIPFSVDVEYGTPVTRLETIPGLMKSIIEKIPKARFDRTHIKTLGASGITVETVYHIDDSDYLVFMDIQQRINLELLNAFAREGIALAFPTQTVRIAKE